MLWGRENIDFWENLYNFYKYKRLLLVFGVVYGILF